MLDRTNKGLHRLGFALHRLYPNSKIPIGDEWSTVPVLTWKELEQKFRDGQNIGVRLGKWSKTPDGYLHVLDVDIRKPKQADTAWAAVKALFPDIDIMSFPRVKSGSGGQSRHIYFVTSAPLPTKVLVTSGEYYRGEDGKKHWTWEVELLGTGKQAVIPPSIHPITSLHYEWEIEFDVTSKPPIIDVELLEDLVFGEYDEGADAIQTNGEKTGVSLEEAEDYLNDLDLDYWCDDWEGWIRVGMALHHEFDGSSQALDVWRNFSKQSSKFDERDLKVQWRSFKDSKSKIVTMRTVIKFAREAAYQRQWDELPDEFTDDDEDDFGYVKHAGECEDVSPLVGRARRIEPHSLDPDMSILRQARFPAPEFPLDIFNKFWQREILLMAENAAAPVDFVAASLLAFSGAIIGNARWVEVREGWREPPILWCQVIGSPSANKSPAMTPFVGIANHLEAMWEPAFAEQHRLWQTEKRIAEQKRKAWDAQVNEAIEKGEHPEEMPADAIAPPEPKKRRVYMTDATLEALVRVLAGNDRGLLNFRDEMAGWYYNLARYSQGSDRPAWLEAYGGRPYVVDRVKDGGQPVRVSRFTVGILGGIQPERLLSILDDSDDGLQSRFMPFWPEDAERSFSFGLNKDSYAVSAFERLAALNMRRGPNGNLEPIFMPLRKKALRRFGEWVNAHNDEERYAPTKLKSTYGKANGHVARVAINLELLDWAWDPFNDEDPREVSLDAVERAIRFREVYLKPMQMRVFGHGAETDEARLAKNIAEWIVSNGVKELNARLLRRSGGIPGISGRTDADRLDNALGYLMTTRWLISDKHSTEKGGRPKKSYRVNERV